MQGSPHRGHISDAFVGFPTSLGPLILRRVIKVLQGFFHHFSDWSILRLVGGQINKLTGRHMPAHT